MSRSTERGLGRGLGALIPRAPLPAGVRDVPVETIRPNPWQPRTTFDPTELEELAQSIREHGVLQPVLVSQQPDGSYQLIAGERRWRAVQLAGLGTVPALVKEVSSQASLELALVENIQRRDLNALEEAYAYRQLLDDHGLTQEALAQRIGKSRVAVTNTLRLLQLPEEVRQALAEGSVTEGHARAILTAEPGFRLKLLARVLADGLSVRETEALARRVDAAPDLPEATPPNPGRDADVERLEEAFRQALGTRVRVIRTRHGRGRLEIHFFSDDELEGLYDAIVGR